MRRETSSKIFSFLLIQSTTPITITRFFQNIDGKETEQMGNQIFGSPSVRQEASVLSQKRLYTTVIPDLIRNPVFSTWIPAFAGMTTLRSL